MVEAEQFFPLYDRQSRVQRVQVRDLNVTVIFVVTVTGRKRNAGFGPYMVALLRGAGRGLYDGAQRISRQIDAHAHVDEGNYKFLQVLDDQFLHSAGVKTQEYEIHPPQLFDIGGIQVDRMTENTAPHFGIEAAEI